MPLFILDKTRCYEGFSRFCDNYDLHDFLSAYHDSNADEKVFDIKRCLYVAQREYATVLYTDPNIDFIGSSDATTCHIGLIVDRATRNCSLCHFDGLFTDEAIELIVESLKSFRKPDPLCPFEFSVYLSGGFKDDRRLSARLTHDILESLDERSENFYIMLCCTGELNTTKVIRAYFPIAYGLVYDIKKGNIYRCDKFSYKGPDLGVRSARLFGMTGYINIYDPIRGLLTIPPFTYNRLMQLELLIEARDEFLLENFSTSPEQEPDNFIENLRNAFLIMKQHPEPLVTYFINGCPKLYRRMPGVLEWVPVENPQTNET